MAVKSHSGFLVETSSVRPKEVKRRFYPDGTEMEIELEGVEQMLVMEGD